MGRIEIGELTRVEGIGKLEVVLDDGIVKDVKVKLIEGLRFFEVITRGLSFYDVPDIEARICAICYASHSVASCIAIENALGIKVSKETQLLRELLLMGELLESHALHLYFLVSPDLFGAPDVIEVAKKDRELFEEGLSILETGNIIRELLGGRPIHGINIKPGGFSRYPTEDELLVIKNKLEKLLEGKLKILSIIKEMSHMGEIKNCAHIVCMDEYLYGDKILSSTGVEAKDYRELLEETSQEYTNAKHITLDGKTVVTGALSRVFLKEDKLSKMAKELREELLLDESYITYNNIAQAVEIVHAIERSLEIIKTLLSRSSKPKEPKLKRESGEGIGYVEAPRGVLVHHYRIEDKNVIYSNIITPTAINQRSMEVATISALQSLKRPIKEHIIRSTAEYVIRAFDPCISCSVHVTNIH